MNNLITTKDIPIPTSCISYQNKTHHNLNSKSLNSIVHQIIKSSQLGIIMSNPPTSALNDFQSFVIILVPNAIMLRLRIEKESINLKVENQFDEHKISSIHNLQGKF
jgi:hypothetical protein